MKGKVLSLIAAGAFLLGLASCTQQELTPVTPDGENVTMSFTASIPGADAATRAYSDGSTAKNLHYYVYLVKEDSTLEYKGEVKDPNGPVIFDNLKAKLSLDLARGKQYTIVFWADAYSEGANSPYTFNTDNQLLTVSYKDVEDATKNVAAQDENRDAFYACVTVEGGKELSKSVTLTRPFAQINIGTNDFDKAEKSGNELTHTGMTVTGVANAINLVSGEATGSETVTFEAAAIPTAEDAEGFPVSGYKYIGMNYILVAGDAANKTTVDIDFNAVGFGDAATFSSVPVQRNYRTNIYGSLLTDNTKFDITIEDGYNKPDIEQTVVNSIEEANKALAAGEKTIVVTEAPTEAATIVVPKIYADNDVEISITLPETDQDITIEYGTQPQNAPKHVNLGIPSAKKLVIDLPESTVTLEWGNYEELEITTADETLIVSEDAVVKNMTVKKGNVKLYGKVTSVVKADGYAGKVYRCFNTQKSFDNLVADKTSGYSEVLIEKAGEPVDGKDFKLARQLTVSAPANVSNLEIAVDYADAFAGLFVTTGATEAKFDNIVVSSTVKAQRTVRVQGNGTNCEIKNSTLLVPMGSQDRSGINLYADVKDTTVSLVLDNVHISTTAEKLNADRNTDYVFMEPMPAYSRGITFGSYATVGHNDQSTTKAKLNLTMRNCSIEKLYYSLNCPQAYFACDVKVENCILDGRDALNMHSPGSADKKFYFKDSKLIGRNYFAGPTEDFANLVFDTMSENFDVTIDNCDVVSVNDPQSETNHQYMADFRNDNKNTLTIINNTKFRELMNPRMDYVIMVRYPKAPVITWDDTFTIEGKEGATPLRAVEVIPNEEGVFEVSKAAELYWVAIKNNINDNFFAGKTIRLVKDIDLQKFYNWMPIGDGCRSGSDFDGKAFKGTFDGNGHTISNLKLYATAGKDYAAGLFGIVNGGTVKNFKLENVYVNVSYSEMAAAAVGMLTGGGEVSGVEVVSGSVAALRGNGAIVGRMIKGGTIKDCINRVTVNGTGANVGGIVGAAYYTALDQTMTIENCANYGAVTCTAGVVGGIAGLSAANVVNCTNEAAITGNGADVAGIVAEQQNAGSVKDCTNKGTITNNSSSVYGTGGIVGWVRYSGTTGNYPSKNIIEVSGNTNYGDVKGGNDAGGIVGTVYNLGIINGNKNFATTLSSSNFAAGIVGNAQFTETPVGMDEPNMVYVQNNVSTTPIESITGPHKALYVYINNREYVTEENNRDSK